MKPNVWLRSWSRRSAGRLSMRSPSSEIVPLVRLVERAEQVQQRALAGAGRADDAQELAVRDVEVEAVEHRHLDGVLAIGLVEIDGAEQGIASSMPASPCRVDGDEGWFWPFYSSDSAVRVARPAVAQALACGGQSEFSESAAG